MKRLYPIYRIQIPLLLSGLFLFATSCKVEPDKNIDYDKVNQEIEDMEIKRLTDNQIVQGAYQIGRELSEALAPAARDSTICSTPKLDVPEEHRLLVEQAAIYCQVSSSFDAKEKEVWEAYSNAVTSGNFPDTDNLQKIGDDYYLYSKPIIFEQSGVKPFALLNIKLVKKEVIRSL